MSDLARMAGVSESTVSRALSGSPLVARRTRDRILELARTARYEINEQARGLARGETRMIEVVFPIEPGTLQQVSDPFFVDMLAALTDALGERGYDVILTKSAPWDRERGRSALTSGRADGVVFVGQGRHPAEIRDFARANHRVVVWGAAEPDSDYCVVGSDNVGGADHAVTHLIGLGRRSIIFLGDTTLPEIRQRYQGYRTALSNASIRVDPDMTISAPFDIEGARRAARGVTRVKGRFDAVFAASDMIALAAIAALREAGLRVPEDVAVVGFDDIAAAAHVSPSLTTVRQDIRRGGALIVEKMMAILAGGPVAAEVMPAELKVRESCGSSLPTRR